MNEFVYFGSTFSSIEVNSNPLRLSTIQSPYTIYSHSVADNTALLHYEKGYMSSGHSLMITLNYDGIEESYYNNSGIADSIIGSMKIDPQALQ